ncbi:terminase large subunit [Halopseudomonas phragmitis]|uniref:Terminase n=1 Tax=Halopseudomonas phragmitis TaxID=1931241 RepID=A0A1V0B9U9_9GAMM|nr:terminase TerL endonuclease subunit [Halopseudomonas phragmitis]AQZ96564.1 terminase [Halopseudomonas phragmitis]
MSKKRSRRSTSDRVTQFAKQVVAGEIIAGPHVRDACKRHLHDLATANERGLRWDLSLAQRAIGYFEDVLRLNGGQFEGKPFEVLPWQAFVVGSLFGWLGADGFRRFRTGYVETAKGSGKSPLAAGIGLYGLTSDGEARAEIYAAATKKDQAQILFRDAVAMVDQSPLLAERLEKSGAPGREFNLAHLRSGSFFRTVAADDGQSGPRPHIALLDEIHEHKSGMVVNMMRAGTKNRTQALIFMITNSGTNKQSVCWEYHEYGAKVSAAGAAGAMPGDPYYDDSFFAFICSVDEADDPFQDERCWAKANPSLEHGIPGMKYLREQVTEARGMPSKEATVRRLNFCQWVESASPWISGDVWLGARDEYAAEQLRGRRCYGGLDLSSTQDLTALVLLFEPDDSDPHWRLLPYFWLPEDGLAEKADRDRVPYTTWQDHGWLQTTPGRAISKLFVLHQLVEVADKFDLQGIAYDRWRIEDLKQMIADEGLVLPEFHAFGQGYKDMGPALDEFERLLIGGALRHNGNPVMTWCAANAVTAQDPAGNRKIAKDKATGRVDGIVAGVMAAGRSIAPPPEAEPEAGIILL